MAFKVAIVLILVTLVPTSRATSDDEVMLYFPASNTLNAAPVWPRRYLRSTESLTMTNEGNAEERGMGLELFAKLGKKKTNADTLPLLMDTSETEQLIPKESEEVKMPEKESKNSLLIGSQVFKLSRADSISTKDNKVKKLVETESNKDIKSIITTLEKEYYWQWYNEKRPAEEIHELLGLPTGPALLNSPLVWFWLDYTIWVGKENMMKTVNLFKENQRIPKKRSQKCSQELAPNFRNLIDPKAPEGLKVPEGPKEPEASELAGPGRV
ncbi:unnamed protein product [Peronospora farinosa]|uniref:RxLR effector protein n=1 Tax=Peronospora farinosa TaxID=134698 RepID=A0AAV0U2X4_9STRA|nr:unnamed protein product [Peronospora farinosa]CAI5731171.1 unnamed protein product [Peronospora farinosa]